jgi:hypothetical protein
VIDGPRRLWRRDPIFHGLLPVAALEVRVLLPDIHVLGNGLIGVLGGNTCLIGGICRHETLRGERLNHTSTEGGGHTDRRCRCGSRRADEEENA